MTAWHGRPAHVFILMTRQSPNTLEDASNMERREVLPLEYSPKSARQHPPFDWSASFRQFVFSLGVAFATGGVISWLGSSYAIWRNDEIIWISMGVFLTTLTLPWPGRVGWKRA